MFRFVKNRFRRKRGNTLIDLAVAAMIAAVGVTLNTQYAQSCIATGEQIKNAERQLFTQEMEMLNIVRAQYGGTPLSTTPPDTGNVAPITS